MTIDGRKNLTYCIAASQTIVIGAGISGLTAATRCLDEGLAVLVLEARDRVGGRTLTQTLDSENKIRVDLGGTWINPDIQPNIGGLVKSLGLTTLEQYDSGKSTIQMDNSTIDTYSGAFPSTSPAGFVDAHLAIAALDRMASRLSPGVIENPAESFTAREEEWDSMSMATWMQKSMWTTAGKNLMDVTIRTLVGAEPKEVSLLFLLKAAKSAGSILTLLETSGAQKMRLKDGAQSISLKLASRLNSFQLRLSSPVTHVDRSSTDGIIKVFVAGSETPFRAKTVIFAVPPSQHVKIRWTPSLSSRKIHLSQKLAAMGFYSKAICIYDKPFWREQGISGEAISCCGPISLTYDTSDHDESYGSITCFLTSTEGEFWSNLSERDRKQVVLDHLQLLLKDERFSQPREYIEHDWTKEEFTGGCPIGFMAPGTLSLYNNELRRPLGGNIFFAGTETATAWIGYMDGAVRQKNPQSFSGC
ncbi:hypothetical protein DFJ73DRAFT_837398 [Zopfochytrium polystomum]|nr:hypothetical protein DFJ73DRAFT_837398 [Zopfochytrium polystomum]